MRIAPTRQAADPRTIPLPLDDGTATRDAPTAEAAWRTLGLPGEVDYTAELVAAANALLPTTDAIGKGLAAFGALEADADVPDGWVDRMVELHLAELEGYWALDAVAYRSVREGGWTATTPEALADTAAGRIAQRARWCAEAVKPAKPALWLDRLLHGMDAQADAEQVKEVGRHLIRLATERRFTNWQATRRAT